LADEKLEPQFNVFISWSGNRSRHVATALRDWLPVVIQAAKPFMSSGDIDRGSRWLGELTTVLEVTKVGIVCLTPENLPSAWLLFEAGALSKTTDRGTRTCTYLLAGLKSEDVTPPLSVFQASGCDREETFEMTKIINKALGHPIQDQTLASAFEMAWPKLEKSLLSLPQPETVVPPKRLLEDMVRELLDIARADAKRKEASQFIEVDTDLIPMTRLARYALNSLKVSAKKANMDLGAKLDEALEHTPSMPPAILSTTPKKGTGS
jgi:hypothetical protein